jgi:hypothetical protein
VRHLSDWFVSAVWPNLVASLIWGPAVVGAHHLIHRRWHNRQLESIRLRLDALAARNQRVDREDRDGAA